jgi:eukaryotic-like serine/threonine-protein kinase
MGAVWRARDELLGRDVAVKEIVWPPHMDPAERDVARQRAMREAQMAARLSHPNVVGIFDVVEEDDRPWIVMELVPNRSLRDIIIDDGPLPPGRVARIGLGILAALRAAHDRGVLHRDVKPANVLIAPEGRVVLTDFGIARADDSPVLTGTGVLVGSPSYISPERARGTRADAAADLWGLGACLYAAVEGRPPFERDGALASLTAVVTDEPDPPTRAGPLWPVISALLRKDPDQRLSAEEAEQQLQPLAEPETEDEPQPQPELSASPLASTPQPEAEPPEAGSPPPPRPTGPLPATGNTEGGRAAAPEAASPETARPEAGQPEAAQPEAAPPGPAQPAVALPADGPAHAAAGWSRPRVVLAAAAAAVVIAAVVVSLVLTSANSPGSHRAAGPPARSSSAPASTRPAASPSPTVSPKTSPSASASGGTGAVPAGFYRFTNSTGFSIAVPKGWQIQHQGHYVYVRDPSDSGVFLLIDQSDQPQPNALSDWKAQAAARQSSYPDYHLLRLQDVSYPQAKQAADWEFTYDRNGVPVHILNRNVLANSAHAYALYWSTPDSDWSADYHYFQAFAQTFRPAGVDQG